METLKVTKGGKPPGASLRSGESATENTAKPGNYFEQHREQWLQEGEKSYVFIIMQSKMIALNERNRIELVLVC